MGQLSKVATTAYEEALQLFKVMSSPGSIYILSKLEKHREMSASELTCTQYNNDQVLYHIRKLSKLKLVRVDKLGRSVTYKLNYDRLDAVNAAAARILPSERHGN